MEAHFACVGSIALIASAGEHDNCRDPPKPWDIAQERGVFALQFAKVISARRLQPARWIGSSRCCAGRRRLLSAALRTELIGDPSRRSALATVRHCLFLQLYYLVRYGHEECSHS